MATGTEDLVRVLFETNNAQNADEVEKALHKAVFITHPNLGQRLQRNIGAGSCTTQNAQAIRGPISDSYLSFLPTRVHEVGSLWITGVIYFISAF
jgi:hypothetical protein